ETMDQVLAEALIAEARPAGRIKAERAARQKRVAAPRRRTRKPEEEAPVAATPQPKVEQPPAGIA
ncbi:MAG TPA: hypothetical protein VFH98_04335, partial [Candidatus Limnocylindria bacterium]|nr:hypothetical protein [Candidatus Limnocylindria bacterium]